MTQIELATAFAVTTRTVRNWCAAGCPSQTVGSRIVFDKRAVADWLETRGDKARVAASIPNHPTVVPDRPPVAATPAPAGPAQPPAMESRPRIGETATLEAMLDRLQKAERATYSRWVTAMRDPEASVHAVTSYRRDWQDTVDRVQKLEKEITSILAERGEFVAAADAAAVITKATAVMVQALDRIGIICGDRIANMVEGAGRPLTAGDYRDTIDREVQRMKAVMQEQIAAFMAGKTAPDSADDLGAGE